MKRCTRGHVSTHHQENSDTTNRETRRLRRKSAFAPVAAVMVFACFTLLASEARVQTTGAGDSALSSSVPPATLSLLERPTLSSSHFSLRRFARR